MAESVSIEDAYTLAASVFGIDEDCQDLIDNELEDRFGVQIEEFAAIVEALIPFTIPAQIITLDNRELWARGFGDDRAFIVKREFNR